MTKITFRPHHFMCNLTFQDLGYSSNFIKNFRQIANILEYDQDIIINVRTAIDSICLPCPHHINNKCRKQQQISILDKRHAEILNIKDGDKFSWQEAKQRIAQNMTIEKFHYACASCEWKCLGLCEGVFTNFLDQHTQLQLELNN